MIPGESALGDVEIGSAESAVTSVGIRARFRSVISTNAVISSPLLTSMSSSITASTLMRSKQAESTGLGVRGTSIVSDVILGYQGSTQMRKSVQLTTQLRKSVQITTV